MKETVIKCDKCRGESDKMVSFNLPLDYEYKVLPLDLCQHCITRFFIFLQKGYLSCSIEEYNRIINDFIIR